MWSLDEITIEIDEAEPPLVIVRVTTPVGSLELTGEVRRIGRVLYCERVHIQGLAAGALGRAGLNAVGRKILVEIDVDQVVIEGSARTSGKGAGKTPRPIRFPRQVRVAPH
jgi:hypothetical protein